VIEVIPPKAFVGLHSHSTFSTGDGFGMPADHIDYVLKNGMDAWTLTDHGNGNGLAHAYAHSQKMSKKGYKYRQLYGVEFYFVPSLTDWRYQYENRHALKAAASNIISETEVEEVAKIVDEDGEEEVGLVLEDEEATKRVDTDASEWKRRYHLVILAKSQKGLQNLFTLVKKSYKDGFYRFPRIDFAMLKQHSEGLVVSTACMGGYLANMALRGEALKRPHAEIQRDIQNGIDRFVDCVGVDNFLLELQFNKLEGQHTINKHLMEAHDRTGVRLVAAADSHYPSPDKWEGRELYKKLSRLKTWAKGQDTPDMYVLPKFEDLKCELYPKNATQMWDEFLVHRDQYDFYQGREQLIADAIERSHEIAWDACDGSWIDTSGKLPNFSRPDRTAFGQLADLTKEGLIREGFDKDPVYVARAKRELGDIKLKGFENYFLTLHRVMQVSGQRVLFGAGRGSGAGSIVNYLTGITDIDPLKYNLLWERFVNIGRASFPDIDTDVSNRDVLIEDAKELFGDENVLPVSNFSLMKLKSLVKDISKFYNVPYDEVNAVTGPLHSEVEPHARSDSDEKSTFVLKHDDCMEYSPRYKAFMDKYPQVEALIRDLFGQVRNASRHAGGVLICPDLEKYMPVIEVKGEPQTPWTEGINIRNLEENGFLKFDFLGLSTMRMVEDCIGRILVKEGLPNPRFSDILHFYNTKLRCRTNEPDDDAVFKHVFQDGRFCGIFQLQSSGARNLCRQISPNNIDELAAMTALYRPGPLRNGSHTKYLYAKANPDTMVYRHPAIEEVLKETYGQVIFQEQFILLAQKLAGFSPTDADKLRKTLVKKDITTADKRGGEMDKAHKQFVEGAIANGCPESEAKRVWAEIEAQALYCFNKSHSVAYAVDSYYSAWLHTYYEKEWLCTVLQSAKDPEELGIVIGEVKQQGYEISQIDVNHSGIQWEFSEDLQAFVPPLSSLKGLGDAAMEEIIQSRPYHTLDDLLFTADGAWRHSKFNKTALKALCLVEGFSSLEDLKSGAIGNHAQLHRILFEEKNFDILRKGRKRYKPTKKMPDVQDTLPQLIEETALTPEWTRSEKIINYVQTCSSVDNSIIYPNGLLDRLKASTFKPITAVDPSAKKAAAWFLVLACETKKTKNGKFFYSLRVTDDTNRALRLKIWGVREDTEPPCPYDVWVGNVDGDPEWGPSTFMGSIRLAPGM
jgi:DNA polymerase-3 subunit alpha